MRGQVQGHRGGSGPDGGEGKRICGTLVAPPFPTANCRSSIMNSRPSTTGSDRFQHGKDSSREPASKAVAGSVTAGDATKKRPPAGRGNHGGFGMVGEGSSRTRREATIDTPASNKGGSAPPQEVSLTLSRWTPVLFLPPSFLCSDALLSGSAENSRRLTRPCSHKTDVII